MFVVVGALTVLGSPVAPSPSRLPQKPYTASPIRPSQQPSIQPGVTPSYKASHISSSDQSPTKVVAPHPHHAIRPSSIALAPSISSFGTPAKEWVHRPAYSPSISNHRHHARGRKHVKIPEPSYRIPPPEYNPLGPSASPSPSMSWESPVPALSPARNFTMPSHPPAMSPFDPSLKKMKAPPPLQILTLPPPPPNEDCTSLTCSEPLTYTPAGSPCGCVWPIQVKLRFSVAIYTFFTLVTELAEEIAASVALNRSQVRIMGANAASQELEKSTVLINLVPRGVKFNDSSAFSIYKKFWNRQVLIKPSLFGAYEVLYVRYPGLPPSPPSPESTSTVDDGPYTGQDNNGRTNKPLGVDVPRRKKKGLGGSMVAVIVLSSFTVLVICMAIAWFLLLKCGTQVHEPQQVLQELESSPVKASGATGPTIFGSMPTSESMSLSSGAMTYTGSAKTFTLNDIERATNSFDASRILGEGGFGLVYGGLLDDGREVAVKVLKRYDQHGGREFLAEVEMLSRLHHRNLVKLVGICTEGHTRCLVYELIPNGSVESHLHGVDQETAAIASMCVQPEVSHRPFMGEVVQALKLVCNEFDEANMQRSRSCSHENLLIDLESKDEVSGENIESSQPHHPVPLSKSDLLTTSMGFEGHEVGSFRRHASSGTLRIGRSHFWQRLRNFSRGSMSEHGFSHKLWP
uniref:Receptor-like serine/threonine-protein kinase ALE2 isoform X2 n=1 Tax=Populus alba TaxID=43335 RepID=A0A4U5QYG4_POPAL|nr:receptor-like serine/threonine-protein kinase ALE2 isoform X2 [Populus alba]